MGNNRQSRRPQNPATRVYDSQGPYGRVKGTPAQLHDRYKNAAREVQGNDRILAESLMQFADHYYRLSAEGQEQLNAERQRRDADGPRDDSQPREWADRENVEPAEPQAPSAPDGPDRGRGQEQDRAAPDGTVTEEQIPILRQRGRPSTRTPDRAADQRPAGEPDSADTQAKPNGDDRPSPSRRGRPRKSETLVADSAAPEGPAPEDQSQPAPRRRGRPPKSVVPAEAQAPDGEGQPAPRRRGRPRKADTAPVPTDSDTAS